MSQALQFMTGTLLNRKATDPNGRVARLMKDKTPVEQAVNEIYLCTVSRPPTNAEASQAVKLVQTAASAKDGLEDLLWTLLNTREFQFVH
jgi:Fic family protein